MQEPSSPKKEFLVPDIPHRPRSNASNTSNVTTVTSSTTSVVVAASQDMDEGDYVVYHKAEISASQYHGSQPTQLADTIQEANEQTPFACLRGKNSTIDIDLFEEKDTYIFGTSPDCDELIPSRHWKNADIESGPWFKLDIRQSKNPRTRPSVLFTSLRPSDVYLHGKPMRQGPPRLLVLGTTITGQVDGVELFHYTYMLANQAKNESSCIEGTNSTYTLEDNQFASGMYSKVYKARNSQGELCACKHINFLSREMNRQERESVDFEVELLKSIHHVNIVRFIDVAVDKYHCYIFTEYIPGTTLHMYYIDQNNYITELESRQIFQQICDAVDYLHRQDIVHRDIKSENVMITPQNVVKLIDFDVWSLGVLLFRMLAGEYPFKGEENGSPHSESRDITDQVGVENLDSSLAESQSSLEYSRDLSPILDKRHMQRSPDDMLSVDPTKRITIQDVLRSDWMRMIDEELAKFEVEIPHFEPTNSQSLTQPKEVASWGELNIVPGSIAKAPRKILLTNDKLWLGRHSESDLRVGCHQGISSKHCMIYKKDDYMEADSHLPVEKRRKKTIVMVADDSYNGTYVNAMKVGRGMAIQMVDGDVLGLAVPRSHGGELQQNFWFNQSLKYTLKIYDTPEEKFNSAKRRYEACSEIEEESNKSRTLPKRSEGEPWGKLIALNKENEVIVLRGGTVKIGRDAIIQDPRASRFHCVIEWDGMFPYLENMSRN
ncbi:hypothetical protein BGZ94_007391, partial [Podila epigama]